MTNAEIRKGFEATIDQFYKGPPKAEGVRQLHFIGGLLQAALHLLPFDDYYALKVYIYEKHGYDPGGVSDGQMSILDFTEVEHDERGLS